MSRTNGQQRHHREHTLEILESQMPSNSHTMANGSMEGISQTPSSTAPPQSSNGAAEANILNHVLPEFFKAVSTANTIGELLRIIPVPAQPLSRGVLDGVYQASMKLGAAKALHELWTDQLNTGDFLKPKDNKVSHLNSIKAPVVQTCKEATEADDGTLSSMNFDSVLAEMKRAALNKMIAIKAQEIENLQSFVQTHSIASRLSAVWAIVVANQTAHVTAEHSKILSRQDTLQRVARVAASIGESSYQRTFLAKKKRTDTKKDRDVQMTDLDGENRKELATLVKEQLKRERQSERDRARSGKGKRSSGISKQQMKKTQKKREETKKKKNSGGARNGKPKQPPNAKRRERR